MKTRLLKILRVFAVLLTISLILFLTLICFLWAALPALTSEKPRVEAYLSQKFNHPVSIQAISFDLRGIYPVVSVHQLVIYTPDHAQKLFSIDVLSAGLHYIYVQGTRLNFAKNAEGHWQIENLAALLPDVPTTSFAFSRRMHIEGRDIYLNFTSVFPQPVYVSHLQFHGRIEKNTEGVVITAHRIDLKNEDAEVWGNVKISPSLWDMHLRYKFGNTAAAHLSHYLPMNLLAPPLLHWLTTSIKTVENGEGVFILSGDPKDFPYETKPGKFWIDANLEGITLDYSPLWPLAHKLNGELIFDRDSMKMNVLSAELLKTKVQNVQANIPVLGEKSVLTLQGNVSSSANEMLQFVLQSPLKAKIGEYLTKMDLDGNADLALTLHLPLSEKAGETQLDAHVNLNKNTVKFPDDIVFDRVSGRLIFNENGLVGDKLTANFADTPLSVALKPENYQVNYGKWRIQVVPLKVDPLKNAWQLNINHPAVAGVLVVGAHKIRGTLQRLYADQFEEKAEKKSVSPEKLPDFSINVNDFRYKDKNFGQTTFDTTSNANGLKLNKLQAVLGGTTISSVGYWRNNNAGINGQIMSRNLKETLKNWGIESGLESQSASLNGQFSWKGRLYSPDIATLQGKVHLAVGKGQILKVSSQAKMDFGRLLTILSFQSLSRRLKLDFTDLTSRGLSFDSITGDFILKNGVAFTENTAIDGELADIQITGTVNIVNQTYQLKAVVTPDVTSSLPIIATIAGGPVAGAAVWAANKLFDPVINKITSDTYTITGPWDKPVIQ